MMMTLEQALSRYATETASDNEVDRNTALRMMDDEPECVAADLRAAGYLVDGGVVPKLGAGPVSIVRGRSPSLQSPEGTRACPAGTCSPRRTRVKAMTRNELVQALLADGWSRDEDGDFSKTNSLVVLGRQDAAVSVRERLPLAHVVSYEQAARWALNAERLPADAPVVDLSR